MPKSRLTLLLFCLVSCGVEASLLPSHERIDGWLNTLGADGKFDPNKGLDWGVIPGPFYTPELGVGLGVALAGLYRPDAQDHQSQDSSLTISGYGSSTGAFGLALENRTFLSGDRWRVFVDAAVGNTPAYYWGKGDLNGRNNSNAQGYTARTLSLNPKLMYRLVEHVYLAADWSFSYFHASKIRSRGANASQGALVRGELARTVLSSAPGVSLSYDSRDSVNYPTRGASADLLYRYYSPATGSDQRFSDVSAHISLYHALNPKRVLAFETNFRLTQGNVPWNMLPSLGDSLHMRGYYHGRYRDNTVISSQIELRQKLSWRHGVAVWLGMGTMAPRFGDLGGGRWLPSAGVGYRFEIKPNINIRLDYGIGKASSGFYFQLGEAF